MRLVRYFSPNYRSPALSPGGFSRSAQSSLEAEIGRLFEIAPADFFPAPSPSARFPVDLYEDKRCVYVRAELPGVNRDDIGVEVVDGTLTLAVSRKNPAADGAPEQSFALHRAVRVPDEVQTDQISAAYENGILTVTLPKREEAKPRKISVAVK